jgi:ABC-2 type transport system ATP-binding protein
VSESVIDVSQLTRRFGAKTALDSVSLALPRGAVYGLVGANGAGKTTLIKHILGLLRAESGSVRVFGLDPIADPVGVLSRIGYLSEDNDLPGWMRVDELIRYSRAFYPAWDHAYAEELRQTFALDPAAKINAGRIVLSAPLKEILEQHRAGDRVPSLNEIFVARVGTNAAPVRETSS